MGTTKTDAEIIHSLSKPVQDAIINVQYYLSEQELSNFLAEPRLDHIYIDSLILEIAVSGHVEVSADVVKALLTLSVEEPLPFTIMVASGETTEPDLDGHDAEPFEPEDLFTTLGFEDEELTPEFIEDNVYEDKRYQLWY